MNGVINEAAVPPAPATPTAAEDKADEKEKPSRSMSPNPFFEVPPPPPTVAKGWGRSIVSQACCDMYFFTHRAASRLESRTRITPRRRR